MMHLIHWKLIVILTMKIELHLWVDHDLSTWKMRMIDKICILYVCVTCYRDKRHSRTSSTKKWLVFCWVYAFFDNFNGRLLIPSDYTICMRYDVKCMYCGMWISECKRSIYYSRIVQSMFSSHSLSPINQFIGKISNSVL